MKKKWRTRDKVAVVIGGLTVVAVANNTPTLIDVLIGVGINVAIVYGVAALIDWFKSKSSV